MTFPKANKNGIQAERYTCEDKYVSISRVQRHPDLDLNAIRPTSTEAVTGWNKQALECYLIAHPIICVENDGELLAIGNLNTLLICRSTLFRNTKIPIKIVSSCMTGSFLTCEIIISPLLWHREPREIGANYKALKKTYLKTFLPKFSAIFKSQHKVAEHLGKARATVFYPAVTKMKNSGENNNSHHLDGGDELPIRDMINAKKQKNE